MSTLKASDIKKKLEGYKLIPLNKAINIVPGDKIRYMTNNEFKGGGVVKLNKYPEYIVLLNVINKASWCMQLKDPTLKLWIKELSSIQNEKEADAKILKMYKEGKLIRKK